MYDTKLEATKAWVNELTRIPMSVIKKLSQADENDLFEITPIAVGKTVWVFDRHERGEVVGRTRDMLRVVMDDSEEILVDERDCEVVDEDYLPMWGTMWAFDDSLDNEWLDDDNNLHKMADCGFRIYESEDYGYVFGIDGAGYDFYEQHWIPLYEKRGLHWHKED